VDCNVHQNNSNKSFLFRFLLPIAALLLVTACDPNIYGTGSTAPQSQGQTSPAELARRGNHTAAARAYRNLAARATGIQRDKYYLESADQWFQARRFEEAQADLYAINRALDSTAQVRKILLETRIAIELDEPTRALRVINGLNPQDSGEIARPYYVLKGMALFDLGRITEGTENFLKRDEFLRTEGARGDNQRRLWTELKEVMAAGHSDDYSDADEETAAWISLAEAVTNARSVRAQQAAIDAWREQYPDNTAFAFALRDLPEIAERPRNAQANFGDVQSIGVLLPMSGRLGRAGDIIKQGIMAANQSTGNRYELAFYDSGSDVFGAYGQALSAGVDAIIGPLDKNNITALSSRFGEVPVLSLNRAFDNSLNFNLSELLNPTVDEDGNVISNTSVDSDIDSGPQYPGLLQFGLAPEDEARNAALAALNNGHTQMVTFTPSNEWGDRVLASFAQAFVQGGGRIVEHASYNTRDKDHSATIKGLLNLDESQQRFASLSALVGEVEFEPRRRQDIDGIFVAAQAAQGRLIRPQLKFHYASRVPVYATSAIYAAHATRNKDLDGVSLPLSAWEADPFTSNPNLAILAGVDNQAAGEVSDNPEENVYRGLTGILQVDEQGLIRRSSPFVTIRGGQPSWIETS